MNKHLLIVCILFLTRYSSMSQNLINTDRPDQSDGSHIVEKNYFQIESGLQFSKLDETTNGIDNVTLIRYGVTKRFEVRLMNQYTEIKDVQSISGFQPMTISFKNLLWWQKGILPKVTIVSYFKLPVTISKEFKGDHFGYTFTISMRHELTDKMKLYSNVGITQDQVTTEKSYFSAVEINYNLTDKLAAYLEYYGNYASQTSASNGMDIGFIYALKNNLTIDLAFGSPTMKLGVNKFISFGMALRLPR